MPWARKGSGFTLPFEAFSMALIEREMPVSKAADLVKEYPHRLWNVLNYWVGIAYEADDQSEVTRLGVDENPYAKVKSGIFAFQKFIGTIKAHWTGIVNYVDSQIANGIMEGINSKIQLAKRRVRGYKNTTNFTHMIYFTAGKLKSIIHSIPYRPFFLNRIIYFSNILNII